MRLNLVTTLPVVLLLGAELALSQVTSKDSAAIEQRSEQVMPFDMNRTMHMFGAKPYGGDQTVMVNDGDPKQVALVRAHLRREALAFSHGDFRDPAFVHGDNMPGLAELRSGARRVRITFQPVSNGGKIVYRTRDPKLITAIHQWFGAQLKEHGSHAMSH